MYCQKCGKELSSGVNYCPNCGARQGQRDVVNGLRFWFVNFYNKHKSLSISYGAWLLLNITLWIFANPVKNDLSTAFYPFSRPLSEFLDAKFSLIDNIDVYDFSEFFFYTILLPIIIVTLVSLFPSFFTKTNMLCIINSIKKHKTVTTIYVIWVLIHSLIYAFSPTGIFYNKDDFYPFNDTMGNAFRNSMDSFSLTDTGAYDSSEYCFYILLLPITILCFGKVIKSFFKRTDKAIEKSSKSTSIPLEPQQTMQAHTMNDFIEESEQTQIILKKSNEHVSAFTYLTWRIFASLIDKFIIVTISFILFFAVASINKEYVGEIGVYSALFHMSGEEVEACAIGHVMSNYPGEFTTQHQSEIDEYHGYLIKLDIIVTLIFTLINMVYYIISELIWKASYGKHLFGFKLIDVSGTDMEISKIIKRATVFVIMIAIMIGLRWLMGVNYYVIIVLFFLFLDVTVLFTRNSLIDQLSGTRLVAEVQTLCEGDVIEDVVNVRTAGNEDAHSS